MSIVSVSRLLRVRTVRSTVGWVLSGVCLALSLGACNGSEEATPIPTPVNSAPVAIISSHTDGAVLYPDNYPWLFVGSVSDEETSDPTQLGVTWSLAGSTGDPRLEVVIPDAAGRVTYQVNYLAEDDYTLGLEVVDPDGKVTTQSLRFSVKNLAPVVSVLTPGPQDVIYQNRAVQVQAQVLDQDGPLDALFQVSLAVEPQPPEQSVLVGSSGVASFEYTPTASGLMTLTIAATDELGAVGKGTVQLNVLPCVDADSDGAWTCPTGQLPADCNDANPSVGPGFPELCNLKDDDCDGVLPADEVDADGDKQSPCAGDCNDQDPITYKGARETCDGRDNSCDGEVPANELDGDGDTYLRCEGALPADCDDENSEVNPGQVEVCDGRDNDCSGSVPEDETDEDGDGWPVCAGDCDDQAFYTWPGAPERIDLKDNNCDYVPEGILKLSAAQVKVAGIQTDGYLGFSVTAAGDLNGDKLDDLAMGAPKYNAPGGSGSQRGAVFVLFGRSEGWKELENGTAEGALVLSETEANAQAGYAVTIAGDMNGDGLDELVVGAPNHTYSSLTQAGGAYVILGQKTWSGGSLPYVMSTILEGSSPNMNLGTSLAGGDMNGDGLSDLAAGVPWTSRPVSAPGMVGLMTGRTLGWANRTTLASVVRITGEGDSAMGIAMAFGNATGDGFADLLVGAYGDPEYTPGAAWWIPGSASLRGAATSTVASLNAKHYDGETSSERIGNSVASGVDVDGDGFDDALVGRFTNGASGDGAVYLLFGGSSLPVSGAIEPNAQVRFNRVGSDECPCSVAGIGDFNGDGLDDFAIGASKSDDGGINAGKVYIFLGRMGRQSWPSEIDLDEADAIALGENAEDQAGLSLAGGDVNGDGVADLVVGAPFASLKNDAGSSLTKAGRVYVLLGAE